MWVQNDAEGLEALEAFFEEIKTILAEKFYEGLSEEEHEQPMRIPDMRYVCDMRRFHQTSMYLLLNACIAPNQYE